MRLGVDVALVLVGREDDDDVGPRRGIGDALDLEAGLLGLGRRLRVLLEADDDLDTRVAEVLRVRVALRAVADDGDLLALDEREVGVLVVEDLSHVLFFLLGFGSGDGCRAGVLRHPWSVLEDALGDGLAAAADREEARLGDLLDAVGLEHPEERGGLAGVAGDLDHEGVGARRRRRGRGTG